MRMPALSGCRPRLRSSSRARGAAARDRGHRGPRGGRSRG
jgi:hypothetical protein